METKHAPTPWRINGHDICSGPYAVAGVYGTTGADARTSEANAAFIVRACNAHEALVSALDECERILYARHADTLSPGGREALRAVNAARSALTLARA